MREQFNPVLETRERALGLIVKMSDVLFDTARYTLRPGARETVAKVAGIVASHPGLWRNRELGDQARKSACDLAPVGATAVSRGPEPGRRVRGRPRIL